MQSITGSAMHTHTHMQTHTDCAIGDDGSTVHVIGEWVGEWTVRFRMSRYSNNVTVHVTSTMVHWQTFTMNCLSGKWLCVRSYSLFLQRSMPTGTKIATCRLTRAAQQA